MMKQFLNRGKDWVIIAGAKTLIYTASIFITTEWKVSTTLMNDILALKGIGPYTAAAISSFAYGLPHAVVDGNVYRILSRYFGNCAPRIPLRER